MKRPVSWRLSLLGVLGRELHCWHANAPVAASIVHSLSRPHSSHSRVLGAVCRRGAAVGPVMRVAGMLTGRSLSECFVSRLPAPACSSVCASGGAA